MTPPGKHVWLQRGAAGLAFGGMLFLMLRWFEHSQVYHPTRELESTPAGLGLAAEEVAFTASDGPHLHGWFLPTRPGSAGTNRVVLVCHGNGGNISHRLGLCQTLLSTGAAVLLFDYRGYGRSEGRPGEEGTYRDAQAAYAWLRQKGFAATNILALGESLGGAVACELAVREQLGGLILQSTFTSIPDLGAELFPWLPVRWLASIHYDTRRKLPGVHLPLLVMHSRADSLIAFHHAERNFAAANEPKWFCEMKGDHNDAVYLEPAFKQSLREILAHLPGAAPSP